MRLRGLPLASLLCALFLCVVSHPSEARAMKPWPVRVVIVTTFEVGEDTGDRPGEFQLWVEREHLDETIAFPGACVHCGRTANTP